MDIAFAKIAAGMVASGILLVVYLHLLALHRKRHLLLWSLALGCYLLRNVLAPWMPPGFSGASPVVWAYSLLAAAGAYLLLAGNRLFVGRGVPRWPAAAILISFAWAAPIHLVGLGRLAAMLPACLAVGITYAWAGTTIWRAEALDPWPRRLAGAALVIWGVVVQSIMTPLLTPTSEHMVWGLLAGASCEVLTGISMLVVFYQHNFRQLSLARATQQDARHRLETAMSRLPLALYAMDHHDRLVLWNKAAEDLTGYEASRLMDMDHALAVLGLDHKPGCDKAPIALRRADGQRRMVDFMGMDADAALGGWSRWGAIVDRTGQIDSERSLRRQRDFIGLVLDSAASLIVVVDATGRIVVFNHACERASGLSMADVEGRHLWETVIPPADAEELRVRFENIELTEFPRIIIDHWQTATGSLITISWVINAVRDESGAIEHLVASGVDVTERLAMEARLRDSERFHRGILEKIPDGVLMFGHPGRKPIYANAAAAGLLGLRAKEVADPAGLGAALGGRVGGLDAALALLGPQLTHWAREMPVVLRDGTRTTCDVSASFMEIGGRSVIICFLRDADQRLEARERIRQVAAGVTHNFNNLLMAITANAQALEGTLADEPALARQRSLLGGVAKAASGGQDMVRRLEAYLVSDMQGEDKRSEALPLEEVAHTAIDLAASSHRSAGMVFDLDMEPDLWVTGRRGELVEVLLNLLANSIDAMPRGGVASIKGRAAGDRVELEVGDNGPGIAPRHLPRLFEPFFSTKGNGGKGLGLSSSRGIVESHGGSIKAANRPQGGACFRIDLPRLPRPSQPPRPEPAPQNRPRRVLLVEDEALVAMGTEAVLRQAGHTVRHAANVAQALSALRAEPPEVVICDLGLPDGSAWDVARAMDRACPMVLITGWNLGHQAMAPPPDVTPPRLIIRKPVERGELLRAAQVD